MNYPRIIPRPKRCPQNRVHSIYGLTRNIDTHNPARIATHEWRDIVRDIASARGWHDRFSFLLRGPGWAYSRRA